MAQALVRFLAAQYVERDGVEHRFFEGCFGIFGHGNLTGVGQALAQDPDLLTYYQSRNEQAMVHTAACFAKMRNRLAALACTTSIGPGATNMITGAAAATVNRLPVLLLPGDVFASRRPDPVLQQLESPSRGDVSVNDAFIPVSRYFDRIQRPEQLIPAALSAMRVLTSQVDTGAVTLALPQDVQTEAFDYPAEFFEKRTWRLARPLPDEPALERAAGIIRAARRPLLVAGGGVIYSEATDALRDLVRRTGMPVAETQAGKGSLAYNHAGALGGVGATGTLAANRIAASADVVIGVGTRYTDFTTASKTAFQNPDVRFVNINIAEFDAYKHSGLPLVADARIAIEELNQALEGFSTASEYRACLRRLDRKWDQEVQRIYNLRHGPPMSQGEVIGIVNSFSQPKDVIICAAGSLPGDLHKLWRTRDPKGYHLEYGYSTMGYEIAGGLGIKMADPKREVYVLVGDGSYLMMAQEIVTSVQEECKLNIVVLDNHGFSSIGGLSRYCGSGGFGTEYRHRQDGALNGDFIRVNFASNAASLGALAIQAKNREELESALRQARANSRTTVICVEVDIDQRVPGYESWWDVPVAEVSEMESVQRAHADYAQEKKKERYYL